MGPAYEDRYHAAAETLAQRLLGGGEPRRRGDGRERELQARKLNRSASTPKPQGRVPQTPRGESENPFHPPSLGSLRGAFPHLYFHGGILTLLTDRQACEMLNSTLLVILTPAEPQHPRKQPPTPEAPSQDSFALLHPPAIQRAPSHLQAQPGCPSPTSSAPPPHPPEHL